MPSGGTPSESLSSICSFDVRGEVILIANCPFHSSLSVARPLRIWEYVDPLEICHSARSQISDNAPIAQVVSIIALVFLLFLVHFPSSGNLTSSRKIRFAKYGPLHPSPRVTFPIDGIM